MIRKLSRPAAPGHKVKGLTLSVALVATLVGTLLTSSVSAAPASASAVNAVRSYMKSLFIGDVGGMEQVLGDRLKKERARTLSNAKYPRTLQSAYAGASYSVVESDQKSATRASVTVRIKLKSADIIHVSFLLDGSDGDYEIVAET